MRRLGCFSDWDLQYHNINKRVKFVYNDIAK